MVFTPISPVGFIDLSSYVIQASYLSLSASTILGSSCPIPNRPASFPKRFFYILSFVDMQKTLVPQMLH
jgi:hypothetical protein